ncbi:MAG: GntR family transcriptional regulator [Oligosphaeraceae bacterium]|nr:GntR family transcriptional regulator [Oligosphaeraceae bacterium]
MRKHTPKRDRIVSWLRGKLEDGTYPAGSALPGELTLKKQFSVARETLRGALSVLEQEGLLQRVHGKGTFARYCPGNQAPGKILVIADIHGHPTLACHALIPRLSTRANELGMSIDICDYHWIKKLGAIHTAVLLKQRSVTGIILIASNFTGDEEILDCLRGLQIPVVLTWGSKQDWEVTHLATCAFSIKTGWGMAVTHLRDQGHRIVATMAVREGKLLRGYSHEEYLALLSQLGLSTAKELFPQHPAITHFNPELSDVIRQEVDRLLSLPNPPTAILCHSDFWADPVYKAVQNHGLKVGVDIAVMGFVSCFNCDYISPPLSSIEFDHGKLAEEAFRVLQTSGDWLKQGHPYPYVDIPLKLTVRASTAIPFNAEKRSS